MGVRDSIYEEMEAMNVQELEREIKEKEKEMEKIMETVNHYGVWVGQNAPVTAVFTNNSIAWLSEEIMDGIDLDCEECEDRDKDMCGMCNHVSNTVLIGAWKKEDNQYIPDLEGEYSAIVGEVYTQVIHSKWGVKGNLCSPCYPGQVDPDSEGPYTGYSLPPDVLGDRNIDKVFPL